MADVTRLKNKARREEQRENWSRAIELYTQALSESQAKGNSVADLSLYNRIGDIYLRTGQKNTAVRYYEEAVERYAEQELHASAIALCNKVLRIHPGRSSIYLQLGRLHLATNLTADACAHYHRYAETMWEHGDEAAAFDALEELIEQTGDAKSVNVWVLWWGVARDRKAADDRVDAFREVAAAHDIDLDELLAHGGSAETAGSSTDRATAVDETPSSVSDTGDDARALPLLDDPSAEAETAPVEAPALSDPTPASLGETESTLGAVSEGEEPPDAADLAESAPAEAETTDEESGAIPWEPEDDEGELPEWEADEPEVAATEDWGPALELGEVADHFSAPVASALTPSSEPVELAGRDRPSLDGEPPTSPLDSNESLILHPELGRDFERPAAWNDQPEAGEGSNPPPPSHGGYFGDSPELTTHPVEPVREALRDRTDGTEAPVSAGHPAPTPGHDGEQAEPPATLAHPAPSGARAIGTDWSEPGALAPASHESMPFEPEAGERLADDDFPLHDLLDQVENGGTVGSGASLPSPDPGEATFDRESSIESVSVAGGGSGDTGVPSALDAEPLESRSGAEADGLADDMASPTPIASDDAADPVEPPEDTDPQVLESLEAVRDESQADEATREGSDSAGELEQRLPDAPVVDSEPYDAISLDQVRIDVEEVEWSEEPSPEQPESESEPLAASLEPGADPELEAGLEPSLTAARQPSLEEAKRLLDSADPPRPAGDPQGPPGAGSGIDGAPALEGEREDAFREWVRSASPQVLLRALTELEVRAELDKGLMVVERLLELDSYQPDLLRKRLEYASALGDDAVVVETHVRLGQSLERAGRTLEARMVYESLVTLDPDHAVAAEAVRRLQDVVEEHVEQEEGVALAHPVESMHGRAAIGGVSRPSGYGDLSGGGALDPAHKPQPYSGVAGGREAAADFEQLLSEFRAELHERPPQSDSTSRTELGASLKDMGRLDDAIRELQAAVREPQAPPMAYELLGEAFLDKGQARVAMRLLRQALQGSTWDEREMLGVLYQLGVAYQELGESSNALGCYERIFSVDIDYKDVQERILSCT